MAIKKKKTQAKEIGSNKSVIMLRKKAVWKKASDSYLDLMREYPIHPIESDDDLDQAIRMLDKLLARKTLSLQERGYRDILSHEIERYEDDAVPMPEVSGAAMLKHLIEAKGVSLTEVAAGTKIAISSISEILSGKRRLNTSHIPVLAKFFNVDRSVFI